MDEKKFGDLTPEEREKVLRERISEKDLATLRRAGEILRELWPTAKQGFTTFLQGIMNVSPAILDALEEDKALEGLTLDEAIESGELHAALERAIDKLRDKSDLPTTTSKRVKELGFPVDKVNSKIWKLLEKDMGGQIAIAAESSKDKKQLNIFYSIDFGELDKNVHITRRLEPFDRRVYIAIGALWAAGNEIITIRQIFYAMGGEGLPAPNQIAKIEAAISKMMGAHIYINNSEEAKVYKYPKVVYDASLLPMERITAVVNGQTVESAIHLFREPPLITFARERKQITTIKRQLLTTPLNKTNENLMLEDCLIESIAHMKNGKRNKKILFSTIYKEAAITEKKQRQRAPDKIKRILDYYQKCGHIKGYSVEHDGIVIDP